MEFTLRRNRTIASTTGHSVEFKADVPTYVPPAMHAEVLAIGAEPVEALESDPRDPPATAGLVEPTDPAKRAEEIGTAIEMLANKNSRDDFTAAGAPHIRAIVAILGWKPTNQERDAAWVKFQAGNED